MALIDISPPLSEAIAVWPGDVPLARQVALSLEEGHTIALSSVSTTVHVGAHVDAPNHYVVGGQDVASRSLHYYYGPCQVIQVDLPRGARILPEHVQEPILAPRVLFRTGSFPDPTQWNNDFNSLSSELVDHVHAAGGILIGIDTPSVDLFDDKVLEAHHALARHDMANLEGVVLGHVEPGLYTLIALPLALVGADASPVRAVLAPPVV
ncbi:MAG: cyclase family protein [Planctomycetes bacterium]|nr:cyclase family protein [Planctomycetota bacterium]